MYKSFLFILSFFFVSADFVKLKNNDELSGKITKIHSNKLYLKTKYSNFIRISLGHISSFSTDKELYFLTKDSKIYKTKTSLIKDGVIRFDKSNLTLDIRNIVKASLKPLKDNKERTGNINVGLNKFTGNTKEEGIYVAFSQLIKEDTKRITFKGKYHYAENSTSISIDKSNLNFKLDYFLKPNYYINNNNSWNRDTLRNLKDRLTSGLSLGYRLKDKKKLTKLNLELGFSYVKENYDDVSDNQEYSATRFFIDYSKKVFNEKFILFCRSETFASTKEGDDIVIESSGGVKIPLYDSIELRLQVNIDWDNSPNADNVSTDINYLFTLGYKW